MIGNIFGCSIRSKLSSSALNIIRCSTTLGLAELVVTSRNGRGGVTDRIKLAG